MASLLLPVELPPAALTVTSQQGLTDVPVSTDEFWNAEDPPVSVTAATGIDPDGSVATRSAFRRADFGQTVAALPEANGTSSGIPIVPKDSIALEEAPEHVYPPGGATLASDGLIIESKQLRRLRMLASFCALFLAGWNGGSTGALLPYIEANYRINYARVSILFVCTFVGYVVAAAGTGALSRRVGYGHALCIALVIELMGNVINSSQQVNFSLMCFGFFVVGVAFATQFGLFNAYFAILDKPLLWTGVLHGIYGFGAFLSPLVATSIVTHGIPYHFFYTTNVGINVPVFVMVWFAFRNLQQLPHQPTDATVQHVPTEERSSAFRETLKSKSVWTLSIFLMFYVGAEESIGGWIVSYILQVRKGSPEGASWVASCFYLGLAIGRITLPALNLLIGERRAVFIYLACAIGLECVAWFVPLVATTAVSTALVGLAISTFYASAITMGGRLIPRSMHADAFALMSSVGQSGSALWPLVVGLMSTKNGIWVVEPTVVALLGAQGLMWWMVPKTDRRAE